MISAQHVNSANRAWEIGAAGAGVLAGSAVGYFGSGTMAAGIHADGQGTLERSTMTGVGAMGVAVGAGLSCLFGATGLRSGLGSKGAGVIGGTLGALAVTSAIGLGWQST